MEDYNSVILFNRLSKMSSMIKSLLSTISMRTFLQKYHEARDRKEGRVLCVGLDPTVGGVKGAGYDFNERDPVDVSATYKKFMKDIIEKTADFATAYKPNTQFVYPVSFSDLADVVREIHNAGAVAILDHKIADIGKTNDEGMYWISSQGFDGMTYCPFPGNIKQATDQAHENGLGLIMLDLMSNPEASVIMKRLMDAGDGDMRLGFEILASKAGKYGTDGAVVGATGHVSADDLRTVRRYMGMIVCF